MEDSKLDMKNEARREDFYCPTCNCHSLGYYQNELCPVCGTKMQMIGYTITQDKNGGEYTVAVKQKET